MSFRMTLTWVTKHNIQWHKPSSSFFATAELLVILLNSAYITRSGPTSENILFSRQFVHYIVFVYIYICEQKA